MDEQQHRQMIQDDHEAQMRLDAMESAALEAEEADEDDDYGPGCSLDRDNNLPGESFGMRGW
jgi:hypothetical protein